jgi:UPF0716 protein FxsA
MGPRLFLVLIFIAVPLLEIYLFAEVGELIGGVGTVALVVFTAVLGALLLRHQGLYTLNKVRSSMDRGELPAMPMIEGAILFTGALLLLLPGFFTDVVGFLTLIPPLRRVLAARLLRAGSSHMHVHRGGPGDSGSGGSRIIEGEYRREDD